MLKSKLHKNHFKAVFFGFNTQKVINLLLLFLSILFLIGWYFSDNINKSQVINKLEISNKYMPDMGQ